MRIGNAPMDQAEFDEALFEAIERGVVLSDMGADTAVQDALLKVARDPSEQNVHAARVAYAAMRFDTGSSIT